jgi:hypothetical protein
MAPGALLSQLPRLSQFDEADMPEGGLDPLGLAAVADRLADQIVPGVRARMSQPRFVTFALAGALACQDLVDVVSVDGATSFDIAFEWLAVEALVRHQPDHLSGVPGSGKARRAAAVRDRLSAKSYLSGPRVFGFTGVYRPFAVATGVVDPYGLPTIKAEPLLRAWEHGEHLRGFVDGLADSPGGKLRREIRDQVRIALDRGHAAAPPTGWFLQDLAPHMRPKGAGKRERAELRALVLDHGENEARHQLGALLVDHLPDISTPEPEIAADLAARATGDLQARVQAAIDYEDCATLIDRTFRQLLNHGGADAHGLIRRADAAALSELITCAEQVAPLVRAAIDAAERLNGGLDTAVAESLSSYESVRTSADLLDAMVARHEHVQGAKAKRSWLDGLGTDWCVRPQYRHQPVVGDGFWSHPMRFRTLVQFLQETS